MQPVSGVARVLGARGQNVLMAPPGPRPFTPCVWPNPNTEGGGGGGGGGVPLEFGQIRLLPYAFDNGYMDTRGVPLRLAKSGADPGLRCGGGGE